MRISAKIKRIFVSIFANFNANLATKIPKIKMHQNFRKFKQQKVPKKALKYPTNIRKIKQQKVPENT